MVNIEIDGKKIHAREGSMVIEAADDAGINIPRFCYHKKLSIAANCRMCLVEVEKAAKPLPACATPVTDGMKVFTRSAKAVAAQKGVMEFLLINHPLDCPICDQGGECELQDVALTYGSDVSKYAESKRVLPSKDFGPLIGGDMTRCIHCTRCVRFGIEIAGVYEMGSIGRGEHMEIGTFVQQSLSSELSGNIIDLCPVGALTSKPFRYVARAWELVQRDSIAPHDCVGSNIHVHVKRDRVVRVVPRENEEINETWLSDRDRFSYEGLNSAERVQAPMIKVEGEWQETDWETALHRAVDGLKQVGSDDIGALASPVSTLEELYLLQKLMREIGCGNIDHRLKQTDFSDQEEAPGFPWLGQAIGDLERNDAVLLIGADVSRDQPIIGHRLRKAALSGGKISSVSPANFSYHFPQLASRVSTNMLEELVAIAKALLGKSAKTAPEGFAALSKSVEVADLHSQIAESLLNGQSASVLMGEAAINDTQFSAIRSIATLIAELSDSRPGYLPAGGNGAGAWQAGALPHRKAGGRPASVNGKNIAQMLDSDMKAYLLLNTEPEADCVGAARETMEKAQFVVSLTPYSSDAVMAYADVILPISPFTETSGTFVNAEGRWQSFEGVVPPLGDSRPAWKVLRVLGNLFNCDGFDFIESSEVLAELSTEVGDTRADNTISWRCPESLGSAVEYGKPPAYAGDGIVRRAESLQAVARTRV
ncbi:MAG TPA: NADH-quinone oxidoreductase subunit G [Chromatiales bacterium]|nr:NADH-quinone oxidoreductase subunit G [Chromatiales bacterium]HEX22125.1 NADH-quinone oxidoreductase subunit G [Chromatiales bacterium]